MGGYFVPKRPENRLPKFLQQIFAFGLIVKVVNRESTNYERLPPPLRSGGVRIIVWIVILVSFAGLFWTVLSARRDREQSKVASDMLLLRQTVLDLEQLRTRQATLETQLSSALASITAHDAKTPDNQTGMSRADRVALDQVVEGQKQLTTRITALEGVLLNEPTKALAVPLLKKDVDGLLDREKTDASEIRAEIAQLYTFSEWFWGGFITIGVALLGFDRFRRPKPTQPRND
jgi:hypothetical protein